MFCSLILLKTLEKNMYIYSYKLFKYKNIVIYSREMI